MASLAVSHAQPTIQEALDGPGLTWQRLGAFGVTVSTNASETHDGVDSYLTSNINDSDKSGQQTRVIGPGTLTFWWNVSSESGFDTFGFWIGPSVATGGIHTQTDPLLVISGTGPNEFWRQETFPISSGTNYFEWVFIKDESDSDGTDRGYLDEVFFVPNPPAITNQPLEDPTIVPVGTNVTFSVGYEAGGFFSIPSQTALIWQLNGANLVGKTNTTLTLTNVQVNQSGNYRAVITNIYGKATSEVAVLQVYLPYPLDTSLDTTGLVWTTSGDVDWFGLADPSQSFDGVDVARSGLTPEDFEQLTLSSYIQTTVNGPGTVKFWWRLSGLETDQYYMSVSGVIKSNVPPEDGEWQEEIITVPSGSGKIIKFSYLRDDFISTDDSDGAYLDKFRFIPATNSPPIFFNHSFASDIGFSAMIQLDPFRAYTIQRSTNLTAWTTVTSFTSTESLYDFLDESATNFNASPRYYRIKSP